MKLTLLGLEISSPIDVRLLFGVLVIAVPCHPAAVIISPLVIVVVAVVPHRCPLLLSLSTVVVDVDVDCSVGDGGHGELVAGAAVTPHSLLPLSLLTSIFLVWPFSAVVT
jgi:hypothetical protein